MMKCRCGLTDGDMIFVACDDSPNEGYAFNLFHCPYCGSICKQDVWDDAGEIWISCRNEIERNTSGRLEAALTGGVPHVEEGREAPPRQEVG
jgi:hypothetical protein